MKLKNTFGRLGRLSAGLLLAAGGGAAAVEAATLTGRVVDAGTQLALAGVQVSVPGSEASTYTSASGEFVLSGLPAGTVKVEFSYIGYPELDKQVTLAADETKRIEIGFGEAAVELDKVTIKGSIVGTARAINQERAADALTNVIASDAIGQFADENAAESLQRVPGLALYRDQGEGRYIIIRGINSEYNHVTLNGASVATPEAGTRNMPLDVIGSDSLGAVEVRKVTTPDMDAEGLGGSVNLRNRSAFDSDQRQLNLGATALYSNQRDKFGSKFDLTYGDFLAGGKVGVLINASTQRRPYGSYNYEEGDGWDLKSFAGSSHYFFNEIAFRDYEITRTRQSVNAAIDYKPSDSTSIYLRTSYADFDDKEKRWVTDIPFSKGTITALTDTSATVTGVKGTSKRLRDREEEKKLTAGVLGFKTEQGAWKFDGAVDASKGEERKPNELEARFDTNGSTTWSYEFSDPYHLTATSSGGLDPADPASYTKSNKSSLKQSSGNESQYDVRGNAKYTFEGAGAKSYLKAGFSYRSKDKDQDKTKATITSGPAVFTFSNLAETSDEYPYFSGPRISAAALESVFIGNESAYTFEEDPADALLEDFNASEDVLALYAMGGASMGKLNLIGGVRMERTSFDTTGYQGVQATAGADPVYSQVSASHVYTNVLPGLVLRYDASKQLVLRASVTKTLSRPNFEETAINRNVSDDDGEITEGNPDLNPLQSVNWDASVDYYLPSLGVVSASVFYKDIKDFTYQQKGVQTDPATGYDLITYVNGPKGHIAGLELAYQQQLRMLPEPFDGLGLLLNGTFSDSSADYPNRPGESLDFIGQSKFIGNFGLTYEKHGVFVRLAGNFRTKRLREDEAIGGSADEDRYVDQFFQLDLSAHYDIARRWQLFANVINLTNEPFRVYFGGGGSKKLVQREEYGWSANFGVRWKL